MHSRGLARTQEDSPFDAGRITCPQGGEDRWSARWLMGQMGYSRWENFETPIRRAMKTAENQDMDVATLFLRSQEKTGGRPREDFELSRYAAYLVAMNGDPNIPEVAAAQHYFAVRTREAEIAAPRELSGPELLARAVLEAQTMLTAKDHRIAELVELREADRPAVEYVTTHVLVDDDVMLIEDWGRTYGLTRPQAFELLLAKEIIFQKACEHWSSSKQRKVAECEYRSYAGKPAYTWFALKEQRNAPRRHNGQARNTLYVKAMHAVDLARLTGLLPNIEVVA